MTLKKAELILYLQVFLPIYSASRTDRNGHQFLYWFWICTRTNKDFIKPPRDITFGKLCGWLSYDNLVKSTYLIFFLTYSLATFSGKSWW